MAVFPADSVRTKTWGTELLTSADLHAQLDLIHAYIQAMLNSSTGHDHDGTSNNGPKLTPANLLIASQAQGDLLYASSSTAWSRLAKGTASQLLAMNSGATAPEWKTVNLSPDGSVVQVVNVQSGAVASCAGNIPSDDTIPQNTEGTEVMTLAITPLATTNKLKIQVVVNYGGANADLTAALFQDTTAGALAAAQNFQATNSPSQVVFTHYMTAGTTSSTTFKVRIGHPSGTAIFNGVGGPTRVMGGVMASSITITEIKAS